MFDQISSHTLAAVTGGRLELPKAQDMTQTIVAQFTALLEALQSKQNEFTKWFPLLLALHGKGAPPGKGDNNKEDKEEA
jgi:hypothetical protein